MLSVGIPKEIKPFEKRVGFVPSSVRQLTERDIKVYVQKGAGNDSGFSDNDFEKAGAKILPDAVSLYAKADLIQKVKEPLDAEFPLLRKQHILFCYLHLASPENCALVETLVRSGATAIGYETVEVQGRFPLLAPMSEIAGSLAAAYGGALLRGGYLKLQNSLPDAIYHVLEKTAFAYPEFKGEIFPGKAVIFGGGVAGFKAMETALKLHGEVCVIEKNEERREFLKRFTSAVYAPDEAPKSVLEHADVLIGCVHARGARAAQVLDEKALKEISKKKNKIIIDISIDQGGNFPESGTTTYKDPVYFDTFNNLRFGVPNMPSLCGRGASEALSQVTLPYTLEIALDPQGAFEKFPEVNAGTNIRAGKILIEAIREAHRRL